MLNFLTQNYYYLLSLEFLTAIIGLLCYKYYKHSVAKYFIIFLLYVTVVDTLGLYTQYVSEDKALEFLIGTVFEKNYWLGTLSWDIGAVLFYTFYYRKILHYKLSKNIVLGVSILFLIFSLVYIGTHLNQFFLEYYSSVIVFGGFTVVLCSSLYFVEMLLSEKILYFYKDLNFYISVVIFMWWIIITPLTFYDVYYTYDEVNSFSDWNYVHLRQQIYIFANLFMYLCFTVALIYCRPRKNEIVDCK
ncbi:hypothetical protein [Pseudotamlana agarivorans]|uniref:hypothetical protein n=1 Tax=Pseudotamlana agarivorans TaxID=481183 RepID=UPI00083397E0|nr:hypothetical protein [Tamlana agarivorans]